MIVKVIAAPKRASAIIAIVRQIFGIKARGHPVMWPPVADYIAVAHSNGERVVYARFTNLNSIDVGPAVAEMRATQAMNRRVQGGTVYRMVVAFPPGEVPNRGQLDRIEDDLVAAIGFAGHQRISAAHDDKPHFYIQIVINKVHPKTLRCVTPHYDHSKLALACAALAVKYGLTLIEHGQAESAMARI